MSVNGRNYDWESIEVMGPGGLIVTAQSVNYKDSAKVEDVYGKGRDKLGRGKGNYEASGTLEMLRPDFDDLVGSLGADYLGKADFNVTVSFANDEGLVATDVLQECVITSQDLTGSQNDAKIPVKLELNIKKILWNGVEPVVRQ